jgi:hypothetical protein
MPDAFEKGALTLGVSLARVGTYTPSTGAWGTLDRMFSVENFQATEQLIAAIARGDNKINSAMAITEGYEVQVQFSGMNPATLAILTGRTVGNISDYYYQQAGGGDVMPWFGLAFKAPDDQGGVRWLWFPKCKLMQNFVPYQGQYGQFNSPQLTMQVVSEPSYGLYASQWFASDYDIASFPPTYIPTIA